MQPFVPPKAKIDKNAIIELRKRQAEEAKAAASGIPAAKPEDAALLRAKDWIKPEDAPDRLRIIFDNSSSMAGQKMKNAKDGVVEFLRNCTPNATAVAIHLLNSDNSADWGDEPTTALMPKHIKEAILTADIILLASEILVPEIDATGGTPLYETIDKALLAIPKATRLIAFSDGEPQFSRQKDAILNSAKRRSIPIDTVYIASAEEYASQRAIAEMKYIAEMTNGIFLDLSKGNIASALKYLAPTKRLMLADSTFKSKVEKGEIQ